ncbi:MAG TPA: pirin family protein [Thermoanaerobaculia bacterium]|nr:pirin family protein [Thermoanaerobaculia bacterium]HUM29999.1 pirin family protein [Thermoanaerobaculia bacterium]HXK68312.1 pirin family protein [Thermoanaerobaculia bacterium]
MIHHVPAEQRHFNDFEWLKTYWLFSFSDYRDPDNNRFGPLRVFNDDIVEPGTGFPTHPHREMEIVTVVLEGEVTHEDSMGSRTVIGPGEVQRMSAGTGVTHSEYNRGKTPVHLCQVWFLPDRPGLTPSYEQKQFAEAQWKGSLLPLASGRGASGAVSIHADATLYRCALEKGGRLPYFTGQGRGVFLYLLSGKLTLKGQALEAGDQVRTEGEDTLTFEAESLSDLILIDVKL